MDITKDFETVSLSDRGTDGQVNVEVAVISFGLPEELATVFLTLEGEDVEVIADLSPAMARKLSSALNAAAADVARLNIEASS